MKDVTLPLHDNVPDAGLAVKVQIPLFVSHDNMEWTVPILLNSKMTIQSVKNALYAQNGGEAAFRDVPLTWKGVVVADDMRTDQLADIGLLASPNAPDVDIEQLRQILRFFGRKVLTIMDIDVGEQSSVDLTDILDNMTVRDVLKNYQSRERRGYLHQPLLSLYVEGETNADSIQFQPSLSLDLTVYEAGIDNGCTLALKTGMFEVIIKESSEIEAVLQKNKGVGLQQQKSASEEVRGIRVHVFDWWKVRQLKDAYSALITDGLSANDQIYLDSSSGSVAFNDELGEEKTLYHYQIREDSILLVKREDFTTTYCYYICAGRET